MSTVTFLQIRPAEEVSEIWASTRWRTCLRHQTSNRSGRVPFQVGGSPSSTQVPRWTCTTQWRSRVLRFSGRLGPRFEMQLLWQPCRALDARSQHSLTPWKTRSLRCRTVPPISCSVTGTPSGSASCETPWLSGNSSSAVRSLRVSSTTKRPRCLSQARSQRT